MSRRARWFWIAVGILCAVLVAVAVFAVVVYQRGVNRRERAIAAVVESQEPLHARDIPFDGPDCSEEEHAALTRLAGELDAAPDTDWILDLDHEEIARVRSLDPAHEALPLIEKFAALGAEPANGGAESDEDYSQRLWRRVGDPLRTAPLSERDRLAIEIARAINEPH